MPPRTIDNLGMDVSTRYAEDQKILDKSLIKEARAIPHQAAEIEVTTPFYPSELETLLRFSPQQSSWASFIPPAMYYEQKKRLFTFQSIPSLGSEDKKESQAQKILTKLQLLEEKQEDKDQKKKRPRQISLEEEEKEKKILTKLLQTIALLDKLIIDINSRRSQYQKG